MNLRLITNKVLHTLKEAAPDILVVAGVSGVVVATVEACKKTKEAEEVLEEHKETIEDIHEHEDDYGEKEFRQELAKEYGRTAIDIGRIYVKPAALMTVSVLCILKSHGMLKDRNSSLMAGMAAVSSAFSEYRDRVVERYGPRIDQELRYGVEEKEIEVEEENRNGEMIKKTKKVKSLRVPSDREDSLRIFDEWNPNFDTHDFEANITFLKLTEAYWNSYLKSHGYLEWNKVLISLGFPPCTRGLVDGWVLPELGGKDGYVSFGIDWNDILHNNAQRRAFLNGYEKGVCLEFNLDGGRGVAEYFAGKKKTE